MTSLFDELERHPECLQKFLDECKTWMTSKQDAWNFDKVSQQPYLASILAEAFRTHTPFVQLFRHTAQDIPIPNTDYVIPTGWLVLTNMNSTLLHDTKTWENPEKFNPERFMPGQPANKHVALTGNNPAVWIFGYGPHVCPGYRFAIIEVKVIFALMAWRCNFDIKKWPKSNVKNITKWVDVPARLPEGDWKIQF
jgi:cytochrome P450